jgi:hypothetical protein
LVSDGAPLALPPLPLLPLMFASSSRSLSRGVAAISSPIRRVSDVDARLSPAAMGAGGVGALPRRLHEAWDMLKGTLAET